MTQILRYRTEIAADDGVPVKSFQARLQAWIRKMPPELVTEPTERGSDAPQGTLEVGPPPTVFINSAQVKIGVDGTPRNGRAAKP